MPLLLSTRRFEYITILKWLPYPDGCSIEQPDPPIFLRALKTYNELLERKQEEAIPPEGALYIDDLTGDDVEEGKSPGMYAVHMDRTRAESDYENNVICRLGDLPGYIMSD